ncbi:MAG TPA: hypothetical protein VM889_12200 [Candidatus Thermoplasmatota archaeon]|nr:hypothetical protein [Candidatus Thermoplasmatota archaeon]
MNTRLVILAAAALFVTSAFVPAASAQSQLNVRSVGEIFVDAAGLASGSNVAASITESRGVLEGYQALALGVKVFNKVSIDGFSQAEKIRGVGSSALTLKGSNAIVSMHDNINGAMRIEAVSDAIVRYDLAHAIQPELSASRKIADLWSGASYVGSLVVVGANGPASEAEGFRMDARGNLVATLKPGSEVAFQARPVYLADKAYVNALTSALANGRLSSHVVTELSGNTQAHSAIDYLAGFQTSTSTAVPGSVETSLRATAASAKPAMLSYDLAYESLGAPASSAAVYVNGALAKRVDSAARVEDALRQGQAAFFAETHGGRTLVLVSTPSFSASAQHQISITANPLREGDASSAVQARSEARAAREAAVSGSFSLFDNGKLAGAFATGLVNKSVVAVHDFTILETRTNVFESVKVDDSGIASFGVDGAHAISIRGLKADLKLYDDAYATLVLDARGEAKGAFTLAKDVKARLVSESVAFLEGPNGFEGHIVLVRSDGAPTASSRFMLSGASRLDAELEEGARVIFRSGHAAEERATDAILAQAVADGKIGSHVLAGFNSDKIAHHAMAYYESAELKINKAQRGAFEIDYHAGTRAASSFVFDSRGSSLAAKSPRDIAVTVAGKGAVAVGSLDEVLAQTPYPKYFVDTTLSADPRIVVNAGEAAAGNALVVIRSRIDETAAALTRSDAFGAFKLFYDGRAVGNFVSLKSDQKAGIVNDFTMISTGTKVFASIASGSSGFISSGSDGAPQLLLENAESKLEFSDTTSAYMRVVAKKANDVGFTLASGIEATRASPSVVEIASANGAYLGSMIITNLDGRPAPGSAFELLSMGRVKAHLEEGSQMIFRTHFGIETELSNAERSMINDAVARGAVAGHVLVQSGHALSAKGIPRAASGAASLEAVTGLDAAGLDLGAVSSVAAGHEGTVTTAVTSSYYNTIQMVTAATKDRVDVTVSSAVSAGKTLIVSLDRETIQGLATGDAEILVDGKPVKQAANYADVLTPEGKTDPVYYILAGEMGTQVLVVIPHFSTHTVTLKERDAGAPPIFMYATIFLGLLVAAETVLLVRRRA